MGGHHGGDRGQAISLLRNIDTQLQGIESALQSSLTGTTSQAA